VNSPTDNELMLQVRDGDVEKLGQLFERHHEKLYNFLVRLTNRRNVSEDLVQEVFFRILKYRHTFGGEAPFGAWMYQLARNAAAAYFRKWKEHSAIDETVEQRRGNEEMPSDILEQVERNSLIHLALSKLPREKREVLILSRFQGLKYEEIGNILNCPVGTIKARVHHALKELRDIYLNLSEEAVL
jgi:RNA polymerase sigma-70 factor (ECF subfamily)